MSSADAMEIQPTRRPRYRYILVQVTQVPPPHREELVRLLQTRAPPGTGIWLTRYDGTWGIVRVNREALDGTRKFLESGALPLRGVLSSGTIAGLQRNHPGARGLRQTRR
jgi:hypothetical protein